MIRFSDMDPAILTIILIGLALRLLSVGISIRNERRLKAAGAVEHGRLVSRVLAVLHTLFSVATLGEGLLRAPQWTTLTSVGLAVYLFSFVILFLVIRDLSPIWTVKVIIAKDHELVTSPLFRHFRHPNYFLNILPELIGLTLLAQAWITFAILFPPYLVTLGLRIRVEQAAMRDACPGYR